MNRNYGLRWQAQRDGTFGRPNQLSMNWRSGLRSTCRGKAVSPLRSVTALHLAAARFMVPMRGRLGTKELSHERPSKSHPNTNPDCLHAKSRNREESPSLVKNYLSKVWVTANHRTKMNSFELRSAQATLERP